MKLGATYWYQIFYTNDIYCCAPAQRKSWCGRSILSIAKGIPWTIGYSARGVNCCKRETRLPSNESRVWQKASRRANCIGRNIVFLRTRYSCNLLRVLLKLFFFNFFCARYSRLSDDFFPRTQQYIIWVE